MNIYEQIKKVLEKHENLIITRRYLVEELKKRFNTNPASVFPSDYCYNRMNKGSHPGKYLFHYKNNNEYKYLGDNYLYTGPIYYRKKSGVKDEVVGEWLNGKILYIKNIQDLDA